MFTRELPGQKMGPPDAHESRALRADMAKQEADHKQQLQASSNTIAALDRQRSSDRAAIAALTAREESDPFALSESERLSLGQFLGASSPGDPVKLSALKDDAASHVQKLLHLGLVRETLRGADRDDRAFFLTRAGAVSLHGKGLSLPESAPTSDQLEEADQHKARILAKLGGVDAPSRNALLEDLDIGPEELERHLSDLLEGGYVFKKDGPKGNAGLSLTKKAKDFLLRKV